MRLRVGDWHHFNFRWSIVPQKRIQRLHGQSAPGHLSQVGAGACAVLRASLKLLKYVC